MTEGEELRADFENDLFGLQGDDPIGTTCRIFREAYQDEQDNWVQERWIDTRILPIPTQPTQPYHLTAYGLTNLDNGNPNQIFMPYSAGEPRETDILFMNNWRWGITNVNPLKVGDSLVLYIGEKVRLERVADAG